MATTARRAGQGDSKVFKLADERWCAFVELPPGPDGKRHRKKITAKTRGQVLVKRNQVRSDLAKGVTPGDDRITVAQLVELWLKHRKGQVAPATLANYRSVAEVHVIGNDEHPPSAVGRKQVSKLTALDVSNLLLAKGETHSPRTVKLVRTILGAAIGWAEQQGLVPRNVVKYTEGPRQRQSTHRAMTEEQAKAVLAASRGTRWEAAFALMLSLGLRPGECLGLCWSDVDLNGLTLTVRHSLKRDGTVGEVKNDGSRRQLTLPARLVPLLKSRKAAQAKERLKAAEYWQDGSGLVFTTEVGMPVSDRNLAQRDFREICAKAKVGEWHLHECRHTAATLMLTNGLPIEVVAKVLGHADIRMTANVYAHLLPRHLAPAAEAMGTVLWGVSTLGASSTR
jgi:integrase